MEWKTIAKIEISKILIWVCLLILDLHGCFAWIFSCLRSCFSSSMFLCLVRASDSLVSTSVFVLLSRRRVLVSGCLMCCPLFFVFFSAFILPCCRCPMALQRGCRAEPQLGGLAGSCRCWFRCPFFLRVFFVMFLACSFACPCLRQRPPAPTSGPDGREDRRLRKSGPI